MGGQSGSACDGLAEAIHIRSDGGHSLIFRQICHSSHKREMSHTLTHKATLQDQTTVMWWQVMSCPKQDFREISSEKHATRGKKRQIPLSDKGQMGLGVQHLIG